MFGTPNLLEISDSDLSPYIPLNNFVFVVPSPFGFPSLFKVWVGKFLFL